MVGAVSMLLGEILFEAARFAVMILLLVIAVFVGGKLRMASDARKAKKLEESKDSEITE